jgi:hypothetical protein
MKIRASEPQRIVPLALALAAAATLTVPAIGAERMVLMENATATW